MSTEIVCVIDRSGSMSLIRDDAIGGFNQFLSDQKKLPGQANLTLVLFNHEPICINDSQPLATIEPLSENYAPWGNTALLDALGKTIDEMGAKFDRAAVKPEKVIFVILTDGKENASTRYTSVQIAERIKHQQEKYQWDFIYLGANQDAFEVGAGLNIMRSNTHNFVADSAGVRQAYGMASNCVKTSRTK